MTFVLVAGLLVWYHTWYPGSLSSGHTSLKTKRPSSWRYASSWSSTLSWSAVVVSGLTEYSSAPRSQAVPAVTVCLKISCQEPGPWPG